MSVLIILRSFAISPPPNQQLELSPSSADSGHHLLVFAVEEHGEAIAGLVICVLFGFERAGVRCVFVSTFY